MNVDTADRTSIGEALARLAAAIDSRDWATVADHFADGATGYGTTGVDAIVARMRAHLDGCGPTQHLLGNHRVHVDGDVAHSSTYARVYHQGSGPKTGAFFECMGQYDDRWTRETDGWRLTWRHFDMQITLGDFGVLRPGDEPHERGPSET